LYDCLGCGASAACCGLGGPPAAWGGGRWIARGPVGKEACGGVRGPSRTLMTSGGRRGSDRAVWQSKCTGPWERVCASEASNAPRCILVSSKWQSCNLVVTWLLSLLQLDRVAIDVHSELQIMMILCYPFSCNYKVIRVAIDVHSELQILSASA
jgi:hypothetical protein